MLASVCTTLFSLYTNAHLAEKYWKQVKRAYSSKSRYYHNLAHLQHIYECLLPIKTKIEDWDVVLFTLFYHDYIYNPLRKNNELKSAQFAKKVLEHTSLPAERIKRSYLQILGTKTHEFSIDNDANYFNDADLAILGSEPAVYKTYLENIRKEYRMYPTFVYNKGRHKVVAHFLAMDKIYKTAHFQEMFEDGARSNLEAELTSLI